MYQIFCKNSQYKKRINARIYILKFYLKHLKDGLTVELVFKTLLLQGAPFCIRALLLRFLLCIFGIAAIGIVFLRSND